jgi:hypothetical protein
MNILASLMPFENHSPGPQWVGSRAKSPNY